MIIHIVHANENIHLIAFHYHVSVNDIMSINQHITDFSHLHVGTKLKIPLVGSEIIEELEESEPFIEDYYPEEIIEEKNIDEIKPAEVIQEEIIKEPRKEKKKIKYPYYYYLYNRKNKL